MSFGPLIGADQLAALLTAGDVRLLDFRWYLDGRSGRQAYLDGHIPGAVFVDLDEITGEGAGRHPLPDRLQFQSAMRRAGVGQATRVIAYDDVGGSIAARLWWLLHLFGHPAAAVLDGGLASWPGEREIGVRSSPAGDFVAAPPDSSRYVGFEEVEGRASEVVLLDARAPQRYRGEVEPVDPRAGHIPGALSAHWMDNLDEQERFLSREALRKRFGALGIGAETPVIAYCGSGVNACHDLLALELAGLGRPRLYAGSWSDWARRPGAPVATGPG